MFKSHAILSLAIAGALLTGCDEKKETPTTPTAPAAPKIETPTTAPAAATPATDATPATPATPAIPTVPATPTVPAAPSAPATPSVTPDATATPSTTDLKASVDKLQKDVDAKDWASAKDDIAKITPSAGKLPDDLKKQFTDLSEQVAKSGLTIPSIPGLNNK